MSLVKDTYKYIFSAFSELDDVEFVSSLGLLTQAVGDSYNELITLCEQLYFNRKQITFNKYKKSLKLQGLTDEIKVNSLLFFIQLKHKLYLYSLTTNMDLSHDKDNDQLIKLKNSFNIIIPLFEALINESYNLDSSTIDSVIYDKRYSYDRIIYKNRKRDFSQLIFKETDKLADDKQVMNLYHVLQNTYDKDEAYHLVIKTFEHYHFLEDSILCYKLINKGNTDLDIDNENYSLLNMATNIIWTPVLRVNNLTQRRLIPPTKGLVILVEDSLIESIYINEKHLEDGNFITGITKYKDSIELPFIINLSNETSTMFTHNNENPVPYILDLLGVEKSDVKYEVISPYYWKYRNSNYTCEKDIVSKQGKIKRIEPVYINSFSRKCKNASPEAKRYAESINLVLKEGETVVREHIRYINKSVEI